MKFIIVFAALIALAYGEYKISEQFKQKVKANMTKIVTKCIIDENASEADLKEIETSKVPTRRGGKCFISCTYQALGVQNKNGKFTENSVMRSIELYKSEDMNLYNDMSKLLVDTCLPKVKSADRCDAAGEMIACYVKNGTPDMVKPSW